MAKGLSDAAPVRYVTLDDQPEQPARKPGGEIVRPKGYMDFVGRYKVAPPPPPAPGLADRIGASAKAAAGAIGDGLSNAATWARQRANDLYSAQPQQAGQPEGQTPQESGDAMGSGDGASIMSVAAPAPASFEELASRPNPDFKPTQADLVEQSKSPDLRLKEARDQRIQDSRLNAPTLKAAPERTALQNFLDLTNRKPLDTSLAGAAAETAGDAARGAIRGTEGVAGSMWSGIRAAADLTAGADSRISDFAAAAADEAGNAQERIGSPDKDSLTQKVFESTFSNLPVLMGFGAGNRALVAMGAQSAAQSYHEARKSGLGVGDSLDRAAWQGTAEVIGEKFSLPTLGRLFQQAASKVSGKELGHVLAELLVKEQAGEQVTTAMQDAYDKWGRGGLKPNMTLDDYLSDVAETAKVTLGQSLLMGGAANTVRATANGIKAKARPTELRNQAFQRFDDLAAQHGLPDDALKAAKEAASGVPVDEIPGVLKRVAAAMSRNGLFGRPVAEDALASLDHPPEDQGPVDASEVLGAVQPAQEAAQNSVQEPPSVPAGAPLTAEGTSVQPGGNVDAAQAVDKAPQALTPIDVAAHGAATSPLNDKPQPTEAQKEAGNYAKGHVSLQGLDIAIENPRGSTRSGVGRDGTQWETTMQHHYGYIKGTVGNDKDHVDTFIGQNPESQRAFVIDQVDPDTGKFDEHKVVLGAESLEQAREIYQSNYAKDWNGLGAITELPMPAFKSWVKDGAKRAPLGDITTRQQEITSNEPVVSEAHAQPTQAGAVEAPADQGSAGQTASQPEAGPGAGAGAAGGVQAAGVKRRHQVSLVPEHDTMLQALAKLGGIRRDVVASEFGLKPEELKHTVSTGKLKGYPFRKTGGMDMDRAITSLAEAGYFDGVPEDQHRAVFEQAIHDELGGSPRLTSQGRMREAAEAYGDHQEQERARAIEQDQSQAELDAERAAIMAEANLSESDLAAHPTFAVEIEAVAQDLADGMRAMGFTEQEIADEVGRQAETADTRSEAGGPEDSQPTTGEAKAPGGTGAESTRPAGRARSDGRTAPADAGRRQAGERTDSEVDGKLLASHTKADLQEKQQREDKARKDEANAKAADAAKVRQADEARDNKDRADRTVDDFQLGQSAEQQMSGMGDLFAQPKSEVSNEPSVRRGEVGMKLQPGETVLTAGGRKTTPFPKVNLETGRKAGNTMKAVESWLMSNALSEAEARGDEFNSSWMRQAQARPSQSDKDSAEEYLFGQQPDVAPSILKPLANNAGTKSEGDRAPTGENKVFTEDAADKARAILRKKLGGTLNSGIDPELLQAGITLAGYHIEKGARTFSAYAKAMLEDLGDVVRPYLKSWYMGVKYDPRAIGFDGMSSAADVEAADVDTITEDKPKEGPRDVPDTSADLEPDRENAASAKRVLAQPDGIESGGSDQVTGKAGKRAGGQGGRRADGEGVPAGSATAARERGDQPVSGGATVERPALVPAGSDIDQRGGGFGDRGIPVETVPTAVAHAAAQDGLAQGLANRAQRLAPTSIKVGDLANIRETLPLLQPKQQEDVHAAEKRYAEPDGHGILFTNGTGTGKTYTGLGVAKRFALQGKTDILFVAPSDKIIEDWIETGKRLGLDITKLESTSDAGKGMVITTYANFGDNETLGDRAWHLVVTDEAHYLMQAEDGKPTNALIALRAITKHPDGAYALHSMRNRVELGKLKQMSTEMGEASKVIAGTGTQEEKAAAKQKLDALQPKYQALQAKMEQAHQTVKEEVQAAQESGRTKVTFLSATPWAYVPTVDWASGYLFDYHEGQPQDGSSGTGGRGYNSGSNRERFFMQHFGYRMRYNKLTKPDAKVNVGLMERQFNAWLRKSGALSARTLDVAADYDRRFVLVESAIGSRIDEALKWVSERGRGNHETKVPGDEGARLLGEVLNKKFDYLSRRYLLEAIKAQESIPYVKQHLALGRKVVVFHDYKKGGGFNPFDLTELSAGGDDIVTAERVEKYNAALRDFKAEFKDLVSYPFAAMPSPIEAYKKAFPDVLLFNGDVTPKDRRAAVAKFQRDDVGPAVILVQSAAGKEGISLHDVTGKHQRALLNLGQPTQPTTAIQQEGRIYRTNQVTDAIFRYFNTGTNWEKWAFATTIASRASTAENLGMGEQARALKDAFIAAFEEADVYAPGHEGEGKGGKERDREANEALTEFDRAVSFYYATQKKNARTKAAEGADYFATPEPLGLKMVEWLDPHGGDHLLEPSAGHGAIARWMPENTERTAVEPSSTLRPRLAMVYDGKIIDSQFEDLHVANKFDGIVMNPPFGAGGKLAVEHLAKAATHLREGGRIVAIIPTGPAADKRFDKWFYEEESRPVKPLLDHPTHGPIYAGDTVETRVSWAPTGKVVRKGDADSGYPLRVKVEGSTGDTGITLQSISKVEPTGRRTQTYRPAEGLNLVADIKLPQVAFERAGTAVATRVLVIERPPAGMDAPTKRSIDLTTAEDIHELFDRIRDMDLAKRAKPEDKGPAPVDPGAEAVRAVSEDATDRKQAKAAKVEASGKGAVLAAQSGYEVVSHVTKGGAGKTLRGVVRTDLTQAQAKAIDPYTFKKDSGWFIRSEHIQKMLDADAGGEKPAFSLAAGAAPAFSAGEAPERGSVREDVRGGSIGEVEVNRIIKGIAAEWKGLQIGDIHVVSTALKLPSDIVGHALDNGGLSTLKQIEGVAHRGKVYIVADRITSREHAETVLFHEAYGHLGTSALLGGRTISRLKSLWDGMNGLAGIQRMARKIDMGGGKTVWDSLKPYIEMTKGWEQSARRATIVDEFLAFSAQRNDQSALAKFRGYVSDVKAALAKLARRAGLTSIADRLSRMTEGDVIAFTRDARRAIVTGQLPDASRYTLVKAPEQQKREPTGFSLRAASQEGRAPGNDNARLQPSTGIVDRVLRNAGGTVLARLTSPGYTRLLGMMDRALSSAGGVAYDYAKAGLVADHGLSEPYIDARAGMRTAIRQGARETKSVIEDLQGLDRAQSRVAYLWMNEKPDSEQERALLDSLPEDSRKVLVDLKQRIDQLSKEAVQLGMLSQDAYERNSMAYLHRSYKRFEVGDKGNQAIRSRAIKILGNQFKGRGLRDDVTMDRVKGPDWWERKLSAGVADPSLKGMKFTRLELRELPDSQTAELFEGGKDQALGKLRNVVYWPAGQAIPAEYADWRHDGTWEARYFNKPGKVGMWRDFTLSERTKMGEIQEVRYSTAKTMLQMTRDVETARLLDWVARREALATEDQIPEQHTIAPAKDSMGRAYLPTEWVQVPDAAIPGTGGLRRYGNLAGRFVPGPIWNDIRQISGMTDQGDLAKLHADVLKLWKISKTALSPTTHMNNVMSNFIFADMHDVQARHILAALKAWRGHKSDQTSADLIAEYQDNGGDGGKFNDAELREDVMGEMIAELEREVTGKSPTAAITAAQVVDLVRHREFRQAFAALGQTKTAGALAGPAKKLMKLYGKEDELFRLAAYIKAREDGLTGRAAGKFAHDSFLNYDINAPWIQGMRRSFFPFISFTYRALPMLTRTMADKPWKAAKYALVAGALNSMAYAMLGLGGDDEDKERALLPEEKAGRIWGIFPKLMRMPWNDSHDSPVFLDVRRWIPAGDVIDTGQGHSAVPVPSPLMPGGPLVVLAELILNKSSFMGKSITQDTDTLAEKYGKVGDYLWKAAMPNFPGVPGTYATDSLLDAGTGKTDTFGREQSLGQAALSTVGIKVGSYPKDVLVQNAAREVRAKIAEIRRGMKADARQLARSGMSESDYQDKRDAAAEKLQQLNTELHDKLEAAGASQR